MGKPSHPTTPTVYLASRSVTARRLTQRSATAPPDTVPLLASVPSYNYFRYKTIRDRIKTGAKPLPGNVQSTHDKTKDKDPKLFMSDKSFEKKETTKKEGENTVLDQDYLLNFKTGTPPYPPINSGHPLPACLRLCCQPVAASCTANPLPLPPDTLPHMRTQSGAVQ